MGRVSEDTNQTSDVLSHVTELHENNGLIQAKATGKRPLVVSNPFGALENDDFVPYTDILEWDLLREFQSLQRFSPVLEVFQERPEGPNLSPKAVEDLLLNKEHYVHQPGGQPSGRRPRMLVPEYKRRELRQVNQKLCNCAGDCVAPFRYGFYPTHSKQLSQIIHPFGSYFLNGVYFPLGGPVDLTKFSKGADHNGTNVLNGEITGDDDMGKGKGKAGLAQVGKALKQLGIRNDVKRIAHRGLSNLSKNGASLIAGMGDYSVHQSQMISRPQKGQRGFKTKGARPKISVKEKGEMEITHSEYIGDLITGTTAGFVSQQYALNPGLSGTFPWLSSLAANFQEYEFKKLVFEYKTEVTQSVSTTTGSVVGLGVVMLGTQYNAAAPAYTNKQQLENSDYATYGAPYKSLMHAVECKKRFNVLGEQYIRTGNVPSGADIRMYDLGFTQVVNNAVPSNGQAISLGEIHVHYTVKLRKPQLNAGTTNITSSHYYGSKTVAGNPFNVTNSAATNNFQSLTIGNNSITWPLNVEFGTYLVLLTWVGSAGTVTVPTPVLANCTLVAIFDNGTEDNSQVAFGCSTGVTTSSNYSLAYMVNINAPGSALASLTLNSGAFLTGTVNWDVYVTPWNTTMVT